MTGDTHMRELALTSDQAAEARLSPAEMHGILRQRLERVASSWDLRPEDVHHLARRMDVRSYKPGEIVLPRGVRADCLGLVVRGQVGVYTGQREEPRPVAVLLPGCSFGEVMLSEGRPSQTRLQALTRCDVRFLSRSELESLWDERQAERQVARLWRLVAGGVALLAVMLLAVLIVTLPGPRKTLALAPMGLGQWCSQEGYEFCVLPAWAAAANLVPADPNPLLALGTFYFERGDVAAAEQMFQAAMDKAPDSAEAHNNLGLVYAHQGAHDQAIAAYEAALELEPGIAAVEHNLGSSLQAIEAHDEAVEHYQTALALAEPQTTTLVNMAIAYYEAGESSKAADAAQEALLLDESLAPAYTVLGAVALESRQPEVALTELYRAITLDDGYGQAYFYLGLAYRSLGQPAEATAAFERALAVADDGVMRVRIRNHLRELYEGEKPGRTP
jgi:tetratricopeptide (TPR) repeat protein